MNLSKLFEASGPVWFFVCNADDALTTDVVLDYVELFSTEKSVNGTIQTGSMSNESF